MKKQVFRPCECQDERHHSQAPKGTGEPNHTYLSEEQYVVGGSFFTLPMCYYCRAHHAPRKEKP